MSEEQIRFVATLDATQLKSGTGTLKLELQKVGDEAEKTGGKIHRVGEETLSSGQKALKAGAGFAGLATNVASAYYAYDNLNNRQIQVARSQLALQKTEDQLNKQHIALAQIQDKLNKLQSQGKENTNEYRLTIEKLKSKQQDLVNTEDSLKIKADQLKKAQDDASQANVMFALNLGTMATVTIPNAIGSLISLATSQTAVTGSQTVLSVSTGVATKSIWAQTFAMLSNPLFAIPTAVAIAGAIALVSTNQFGLRDAIFGTSKAQQDNTQITNSQQKAQNDLSQSYDEGGIYLEDYTEKTNELSSSLSGLEKQYVSTAEKILAFNEELAGKGTQDIEDRIKTITLSLYSMDQQIDRNSQEWKRASLVMVEAIKDVALELDKTSDVHAHQFVDAMRQLGKFTVAEFKDIYEAIKDVNEELDKTDKKKASALDDIGEVLVHNGNLAIIRAILDQAIDEYDNGNIEGAIYLEQQAQRIGRSSPSLSGSLRSLESQMAKNSQIRKTISNLGGGFSFLGFNSNSLFTANDARIRGFGSVSKTVSGTLGSISHALSQFSIGKGTNGGNSVSNGGSRASGRSSKHGGSNRHDEYQARIAYQRMIGGFDNRDTLQSLTGINLRLQVDRDVQKGRSGRANYRFDLLSMALSEANNRVGLMSTLSSLGAYDSDIMGLISGDSGYKLSSAVLQGIINSERLQISSNAELLGLSQANVISSRSSILTQNDISNMIAFKERESLAMITV
ncbi:tail tape measure protein [Nitrososphaeria virus YSH_1032793]|uniref:Tail tape measure protein n=1 Tax=Nitrososphaeria virus YSH_1032793 TaxID=3071320 RepID=A0A976YEY6_9CAUD|nr:tail tape measure protein [Yangshan Harbor Nitrososphaeria virus]UVF62231.1 tail tape measure protein [Nitrososphaeria virus YSH_1032793]